MTMILSMCNLRSGRLFACITALVNLITGGIGNFLLVSMPPVSTVRAPNGGRRQVLIIGAGGRMGAALAQACPQPGSWMEARRLRCFSRARARSAAQDFRTLIYGGHHQRGLPRSIRRSRGLPTPIPRVLRKFARGENALDPHQHRLPDGRTPRRARRPTTNPSASTAARSSKASMPFTAISPDFPSSCLMALRPRQAGVPDTRSRARVNDRVQAIADKVSCPTYSEDLARVDRAHAR